MKLQSGFPLFLQQFKALLWKNLLLSWRNKRVTFLQLFASFFFVFLIFCAQKSIEARFSSSTSNKRVIDPDPVVSPPIPRCEDKYYIKLPCYDFIWSGNGSVRIRSIVNAIMANNPGMPIPSSKVKSFRTAAEVDEWLNVNPMYCPGALHFMERNATVISYGIQTNSTLVPKRGNYEDPTFKFQVPLQIAAEREIARSLIGVSNFSWIVALKEFAHPALESFSAINTVGPPFFLATAMFGFVFQMSSLVTEKELKLRQAMTIMGLYDSAYWLSWLLWEGILTFLSSLFTVLFGMIFQFDIFLNNSFAVVFLVFFLFQLSMLGVAFMLSTFISKSSSSTTVGFSVFIVGASTQLVGVFRFPYSKIYPKTYQNVWSCFPPNLLAKALWLLADATSTSQDVGISWIGRAKCAPNDEDCVITMNDIFEWFVVTFFLWFALAIYFDNIIPNEYGVKKSAIYFLNSEYWTGRARKKVEASCRHSLPPEDHLPPDDEDVLGEENIIKQHISKGINDSNIVVQIRGLVKTYPGTTETCCFQCKKYPPYHALKGLWLNFSKDQLFCLLGTSGAGKTTLINCLTGMTPITGGDAFVYGHSIQSSAGISNIRKLIGVCPQFDTLWDALSGDEHLYLFASIKGLPPASIKSAIENSLEEVRLAEVAKARAGSYSGGMRRRLSVAIALIGDPKFVILDEPTTGTDPITRRHVWDIIEKAKKGRAIVLTTHSMEEADILSDRIGIMANGKLKCIGTTTRLKSRFGTGFVANVSLKRSISGKIHNNGDVDDDTRREAVKKFFKDHIDVVPKEEKKHVLSFVIPPNRDVLLPDFFAELQEKETELGIADIQLGFTTLEEVFLNIARQAMLETATAKGRQVTFTLTSSGVSVKISVGARFVRIPGTETEENPRGNMVEVYWEQDDWGALCISGHSAEIPIPLNLNQQVL
ncbi:hypothetical protein UlMin_008200 [Ulmus minor]